MNSYFLATPDEFTETTRGGIPWYDHARRHLHTRSYPQSPSCWQENKTPHSAHQKRYRGSKNNSFPCAPDEFTETRVVSPGAARTFVVTSSSASKTNIKMSL